MDKIARVRQEIERLKKYYAECGYPGMGKYEQGNKQGRLDTLDYFLSFLNTLSEEPDKSLEEAAEKYTQKMLESWRFNSTGCRPLREPFIAGAEWQKSQMLKEAVEHYVIGEIAGSPVGPVIVHYDDNLTIGDKVRILVLKAEEE